MIKAFQQMMEPIARRVLLAISRASVHSTNDASKRQTMQVTVLSGEDKDVVERLQNYGFTSVPVPGAQALVLCVGGNRDHPLIVAADDPRHRKNGMKPGEVAVYSLWGDYILFKEGGGIEIHAPTVTIKASEKVRVETPEFEVTGDIIDRCDDIDRSSMRGMRDIFDLHTHAENNTGDTDRPTQRMGVGT